MSPSGVDTPLLALDLANASRVGADRTPNVLGELVSSDIIAGVLVDYHALVVHQAGRQQYAQQ
jgi:hypothetical protein